MVPVNPHRSWSPRVYVAVATGLFLAATATHFALRSEAADSREIAASLPPAAAPGPERFANHWWDSEAARCPTGASLYGAAPPDGREVWCARPDGTRDGPHVAWHANEQLAFRRDYRDGLLDGVVTEWFPSGQIARQGQHRAGVRQGQWVRWTADGEVAEVVTYDDQGIPTSTRKPSQ